MSLVMLDPQATQHGGLQVMDMHWIFGDVITEVVGLTDDRACLHSAAGHPHREATGVMIASIVCFRQLALAIYGATEFAAPDH